MSVDPKLLKAFKDLPYLPSELPCGASVNQDWHPGKTIECCRTVCPTKDIGSIEACHSSNKKYDPLNKYGQAWNNPNQKDRLFNH